MIRSLLLMLIAMLLPSLVAAQTNDTESIRLSNPRISTNADGGWVLDAEVQVRLSPVLIDAVQRGVPLYFVTEAEVFKTRWYWFDKKIISQSKTVRVMFHAITQQYRVAIGGLHQSTHDSLEEALAAAVSLRGWPISANADPPLPVLFKDMAKNPKDYENRVRVRLDSAQLPKPLQINALTNRDWALSSDWVVPKLMAETAGSAP